MPLTVNTNPLVMYVTKDIVTISSGSAHFEFVLKWLAKYSYEIVSTDVPASNEVNGVDPRVFFVTAEKVISTSQGRELNVEVDL